MGTTTYVLRLVTDPKKEILAPFNDEQTLRDNLARILPKAMSEGFVPPGCTVDFVEILHGDVVLNLDLPVKEQGVKQFDVLLLEDLSAVIGLRIRFKPDKCNAMMRSLSVSPNTVLKDALKDFAAELRSKHRFYGRVMKKFDLVAAGKRLNLKKTLHAQGIKADTDITLKPRIWFEWPPGRHWPPGPFTTYAIGLGAVGLAVGLLMLLGYLHKDEYVLELRSEGINCWVRSAAGKDFSLVGPGKVLRDTLACGEHRRYLLYPNRLPIDSLDIWRLAYLSTERVGSYPVRIEDSLDTDLDPSKIMPLKVGPKERKGDSEAYFKEDAPFTVLINRFSVDPDTADPSVVAVELPPGRYGIGCVVDSANWELKSVEVRTKGTKPRVEGPVPYLEIDTRDGIYRDYISVIFLYAAK